VKRSLSIDNVRNTLSSKQIPANSLDDPNTTKKTTGLQGKRDSYYPVLKGI